MRRRRPATGLSPVALPALNSHWPSQRDCGGRRGPRRHNIHRRFPPRRTSCPVLRQLEAFEPGLPAFVALHSKGGVATGVKGSCSLSPRVASAPCCQTEPPRSRQRSRAQLPHNRDPTRRGAGRLSPNTDQHNLTTTAAPNSSLSYRDRTCGCEAVGSRIGTYSGRLCTRRG